MRGLSSPRLVTGGPDVRLSPDLVCDEVIVGDDVLGGFSPLFSVRVSLPLAKCRGGERLDV